MTHSETFRSGGGSKCAPEKLLVNDTLITDPGTLLSTWVNHFESGGKFQASSNGLVNDEFNIWNVGPLVKVMKS